MLLARTEVLSRPIDHILFEDLLLEKQFKIYQLVPALCIQESRISGASSLPPELQSTIQSKKRRLPRRQRALRELKRPFAALGMR
jgi:glycosyl transferase family 25